MKTVTWQLISEPNPRSVIIECNDSDTCPCCGAGYRVGLSACEYCKEPVKTT